MSTGNCMKYSVYEAYRAWTEIMSSYTLSVPLCTHRFKVYFKNTADAVSCFKVVYLLASSENFEDIHWMVGLWGVRAILTPFVLFLDWPFEIHMNGYSLNGWELIMLGSNYGLSDSVCLALPLNCFSEIWLTFFLSHSNIM